MTHQDSAFLRTAVGVLAGLALFTAVIMFLANTIVSDSSLSEATTEPMVAQAIEERIRPVGQVTVAASAPPAQEAAAAAAPPAPAPAPAPAAASAPDQPAAEQPTAAAAGGTDLAKGKQTFTTFCIACHGTGAAGAPKLDDKANWAPRIAQGMDTLYDHAIKGFKVMPPRGTCTTCSDDDIKSAVSYMVGEVNK